MSVYSWGANSHGQLALGYESELCMTPQVVTKLTFVPQQVRCIRGGGGHVLVLDSNGRVHACGWNNRGQLGLDSTEECHNEFQCIPGQFFDDVPIESVSCGWDISGAITVTKRLYVWGSNSFQQLGICQRGFNAVRRPMPVNLPRDEVPRRISFGLRHCAVLTEDNKIYIFGRLRLMDPLPVELAITTTSLNRVDMLKIQAANPKELHFISLASGQHHLLLKCLDMMCSGGKKRIIALGDNKFGQSNSFEFEDDVRQMSVGWTHNAVILKNNRILLWGRNCYGQLGNGKFSQNHATPVPLHIAESVEPAWIHLGAEHGLLRTKKGEVYTWGWNEHGNCGNNSVENLHSPTLVPNLHAVCKIGGTGAGFCYAIFEETSAD